MGTGEQGRRSRVGWATFPLAGLAGVLVVIPAMMLPASGQEKPAGPYRTAPDMPMATSGHGLRSQRQIFRSRLEAVQAEIGRLNIAIDTTRSSLKTLDAQVLQAHLNMLAAEHLVYEAERRGLPDLLERKMRADDRRREWETLEARYRLQIEADASGLLELLTRDRALAADLVVDWNLANDRLRLSESATPPQP